MKRIVLAFVAAILIAATAHAAIYGGARRALTLAGPSSFLETDLLAWWDADPSNWGPNGGMTDDGGGLLSSWRDIVGGFEVTAATTARPTFSLTSFGGVPGVTFDGTANTMTGLGAALLAMLPKDGVASEIWVLAQNNAATGARMFASYGAGNTTGRGVGNSATTARAFTGFDNGGTPATQNTDFGTFNTRAVLRAEFGSAQTMGTLNGVAGIPSNVIPATTVTRVRIGAGSGGAAANFGLGVVATIMITRALSSAKASALTSYLMARRGL